MGINGVDNILRDISSSKQRFELTWLGGPLKLKLLTMLVVVIPLWLFQSLWIMSPSTPGSRIRFGSLTIISGNSFGSPLHNRVPKGALEPFQTKFRIKVL